MASSRCLPRVRRGRAAGLEYDYSRGGVGGDDDEWDEMGAQ